MCHFISTPAKYSNAFSEKCTHIRIFIIFLFLSFFAFWFLQWKWFHIGIRSHRCNSNCSNSTFSLCVSTNQVKSFYFICASITIQVTLFVLTIITWCWKIVSALSLNIHTLHCLLRLFNRIFLRSTDCLSYIKKSIRLKFMSKLFTNKNFHSLFEFCTFHFSNCKFTLYFQQMPSQIVS